MAYSFPNAGTATLTCDAPVTSAPLTIAYWARRLVNNSGNAAAVALNSTLNNHEFTVYNAQGFYSSFFVRDAGGFSQPQATFASDLLWHHFAGVTSATNSRVAYADGVVSVTNTVTRTPASINRLVIGGQANADIAEVGIWNAALSADEVASLAKGVACRLIRPQSLVFYAPLVRDLVDLRGGLTITNNNSATVANHPRVYA